MITTNNGPTVTIPGASMVLNAKTVGGVTGVSMLEVMVALLLLSVGVLGIAALQAVALQTSADARCAGLAGWNVSETLERMMGWPFDDHRLVDRDCGFYPDQPDHGPFAIGNTGETIEWEVHLPETAENMKQILVTHHRVGVGGTRRETMQIIVKARSTMLKVPKRKIREPKKRS